MSKVIVVSGPADRRILVWKSPSSEKQTMKANEKMASFLDFMYGYIRWGKAH